MIYEKEVKELLGAEVYKTFLAAADSGEISEQQMADIAFELHEKVGGEFKRARESKSFKCDRTAARTDLAKGQTDKLIRIPQSDDIALKPLAARIIKAQQSFLSEVRSKEALDEEDKLFAKMFPFGNFSKKDIRGTYHIFYI